MASDRFRLLDSYTSCKVLAADGSVSAVAARYHTTSHEIWTASSRIRKWKSLDEETFLRTVKVGDIIVLPVPANEMGWEWERYTPSETTLAAVCDKKNNDPVVTALRKGMAKLTPAFLWSLSQNVLLRQSIMDGKSAADAASLDQHPEKAQLPAGAVVMIPYPVLQVAPAVSASPTPVAGAASAAGTDNGAADGLSAASVGEAGNSAGDAAAKTITVVLPSAASDVDPPTGSIYELLPVEVRKTLGRSFRDRVNGAHRARENLQEGFSGPKQPETVWDALDNMTATNINVLVRLFERTRNIEPALWEFVRYVVYGWYGSSLGWLMVFWKKERFGRALDATGNICKDTPLGDRQHQTDWTALDCDCWREISDVSEGLHFCLGNKENAKEDNIHIDPVDPAFHATLGYCDYNPFSSVPHLAQVNLGIGVEVTPFYQIDLLIAEMRKILADPAVPQTPERIAAGPKLDVLEKDWNRDARMLACKGAKGFERVLEILNQAKALRDEIKPESVEPEDPNWLVESGP